AAPVTLPAYEGYAGAALRSGDTRMCCRMRTGRGVSSDFPFPFFGAVLASPEALRASQHRMGTGMNRILISTASALALMAGAAGAQSFSDQAGGATVLDTISVTANRTPTEKSKTGSKVEQV